MFRVGRSDERVLTAGLSHMVEHLALFGFGPATTFPYNGYVDGWHTVFHATGEPEEVATFLERVCKSLSDLPLDRLEHEAQVLRTEATTRSWDVVTQHLWYRFGSRGFGLLHLEEYALQVPNRDAVAGWGAANFTRENAAVWLSGPVPRALRLPLPSGVRRPPSEVQPIDEVRLPAWALGPDGGVGASFVTARDDWFGALVPLVIGRLEAVLRYGKGLTYAVTGGYMPVDARLSHSTISAACMNEQAQAVTDLFVNVLKAVAADGFDSSELDRVVAQFDRSHADPEAIFQSLDAAASAELFSRPVRSPADLRDELVNVTLPSARERARAALETALLTVPAGVEVRDEGFVPYPTWSPGAVGGHHYVAASQRYTWSRKKNTLWVAPEGVSLVTREGNAATVWFDACEGIIKRGDVELLLYGSDGFIIQVRLDDWDNGRRALKEIENFVPDDLVLELPA
jgi:hypothetical protein